MDKKEYIETRVEIDVFEGTLVANRSLEKWNEQKIHFDRSLVFSLEIYIYIFLAKLLA